MRATRVIRRVVLCYALICAIFAIFLEELAFRPQRVLITQRQKAEATASRFGALLQDVSVTASDGSHLQGWFARPRNANGDAVILLHGVGDNRQGMMGFAELFLSQDFSVLVPDSRAQGESGGDFPTYGIKESDDVGRWFDWLVMHQRPKCVFGIGESMGAAILLQAVEKESRFCAVVAESFVCHLPPDCIRASRSGFPNGDVVGQGGFATCRRTRLLVWQAVTRSEFARCLSREVGSWKSGSDSPYPWIGR
jgi:pimeloyl-ACP methyl ester carboxylesterase